jgi:hypothetical protein
MNCRTVVQDVGKADSGSINDGLCQSEQKNGHPCGEMVGARPGT